MSASDTHAERAVFQPFQCQICQRRFTRQENLKRHAALHCRSPTGSSLSCHICQTAFSRPDLRLRHMKKQHPSYENERAAGDKRQHESPPDVEMESLEPFTANINNNDGRWGKPATRHHTQSDQDYNIDAYEADATDFSTSAPTSAGEVDDFSIATSLPSTLNAHLQANTPDLDQDRLLESLFSTAGPRRDAPAHLPAQSPSAMFENNYMNINSSPNTTDKLSSNESPQFHDAWSPSASQCLYGYELFFTHISPFVPFLHRSTTLPTSTPKHLLLSILSLGYQYGEDPECDDENTGSGVSLAIHCFHRARAQVRSTDEDSEDTSNNLSMIQACLLLQICAMMYLCGKYSAYGLKLHSRMISLVRTGALMQSTISSETSVTSQGLEALWEDFVVAESRKRTAFAVHQIDALWYQFLSVPRSISHLEIKHDLPCPADYWRAPSAADWAFQRLKTRYTETTMPYAEVIRCFLSGGPNLDSIPPFDPYGAINIAQFLISSGREASGWASITGMLSMERLNPLTKSLVSLRPYLQAELGAQNGDQQRDLTCEAIWETAMIELQMWSMSHTGGIVESSMDAMIHQSAYLASSCESLCDSGAAKSLKPHIDWYLQYLDAKFVPVSEAPWVVLYAYKAFLIAWQLLRDGFPDAMKSIGVIDGDTQGAVRWARTSFERRRQWQLSRLILASLEQLEK